MVILRLSIINSTLVCGKLIVPVTLIISYKTHRIFCVFSIFKSLLSL
uniref:Uncharacterized protein n=1 Tax=Myoviridae sp. ctjhW4 TaxID=2825162 RepID=A0A8S5PRD9_9CAUD|nr:MAG TPA: hypothetical protein [Myoviridae sp. ctjhW4]